MDTADKIRDESLRAGGDGSLVLYFQPGLDARRPWRAVTTIKAPRRPNRYLAASGLSPADAMDRLHRRM